MITIFRDRSIFLPELTELTELWSATILEVLIMNGVPQLILNLRAVLPSRLSQDSNDVAAMA